MVNTGHFRTKQQYFFDAVHFVDGENMGGDGPFSESILGAVSGGSLGLCVFQSTAMQWL